MNRMDTLRAIAAHTRKSHAASLFAVGWWAARSPQEELDGLLEALQEVALTDIPLGHLAAFEERFGRLPDQRKP